MIEASSRRGFWLWIAALLLMLATVIYQRRTGPTYPKRGQLEGQRYALLRSQETSAPARIEVPDRGEAQLHWRRYPSPEPFTALPMGSAEKKGKRLRWAELPIQPSAGKLEYWVELQTPSGQKRLPESGTVILRYKDPVPTPLLAGHVILMFFGVLLGLRTGLAALFAPGNITRLTAWTFGCLSLGGMILGPLVQKYAFGALWTGWPLGYDLTDNKTLIMWLVWGLAGAFLLWGPRRPRARRLVVGLATCAMAAVYLVPHSLRGSQLDYSKVKAGQDAKTAITTGR